MATRTARQLITITFRATKPMGDEVRAISDRSGESQSTVIRELIRRGLERRHEQQQHADGPEAA